jgi:regulator of protease activity HflC (stomatin/prohibitin superfamily)
MFGSRGENTESKKGFIYHVKDEFGDNVVRLNTPKIIRLACLVLGLAIIVFVGWPFSIINANERGIQYIFGEAMNEVLEPGIHAHAPVVGKIKTWKIVPNKLAIDIPIDNGGAISKDNQIIGARLIVYWNYDPERIYEAATKYTDQSIENMLASQANASIKTVIGSYTIFDLAANQETIGTKVLASMNTQTISYPILLTQLNISNFDWSSEFDQQIQATMNAAQQVKQAEQKANIAEQENRRLAIEAEAQAKASIAQAEGRLRTAELDSQAAVAKANGERDAAIARATGEAESYRLMQTTLQTQIRIRELDIEFERAKRWNGVEVPTYLPLTPAGGIVTLPATGGR